MEVRGEWLALGAVAALAVAGIGVRGSASVPSVDDLRATFKRQAGSANVASINPAEVFLRMEPTDVPDDLLVAVLLSGTTGGRNAADVALDLLTSARGDLSQVIHHLPTTRGVGERGRARLTAASEMYRRANYRAMAGKGSPIVAVADVVEVLRAMSLGDVEQLVAVYLDGQHRVLATRRLSVGSAGFTIVDPRIVFRPAIQLGAKALIMAHNHPSGNARPSGEDLDVTNRVVKAGKVLGVNLLDSLVLSRGAEDAWTSIRLEGSVAF
jgi:DNA repair protein RadC